MVKSQNPLKFSQGASRVCPRTTFVCQWTNRVDCDSFINIFADDIVLYKVYKSTSDFIQLATGCYNYIQCFIFNEEQVLA